MPRTPGTPVRAIADGVIVRAGWAGGYGRLVEIRHANGTITRYGHLSAFTKGLAPRMQVTQGTIIGAVGSSGLATGPHLHFELRVNGVATDPRFLPQDGRHADRGRRPGRLHPPAPAPQDLMGDTAARPLRQHPVGPYSSSITVAQRAGSHLHSSWLFSRRAAPARHTMRWASCRSVRKAIAACRPVESASHTTGSRSSTLQPAASERRRKSQPSPPRDAPRRQSGSSPGGIHLPCRPWFTTLLSSQPAEVPLRVVMSGRGCAIAEGIEADHQVVSPVVAAVADARRDVDGVGNPDRPDTGAALGRRDGDGRRTVVGPARTIELDWAGTMPDAERVPAHDETGCDQERSQHICSQVPPTTGSRMRAMTILLALSAAPLAAQQVPPKGTLSDAQFLLLGRQVTEWFFAGQTDSLLAHSTPDARERAGGAEGYLKARDQLMVRAGGEDSVVSDRMTRRKGNPQYWRESIYEKGPGEPIVLRFVFNAQGEIIGVGMGPLSQTPAPD